MESAVDVVAVLGTLATVVVAIMTWRIASRQTSIAADMKELTDAATRAQQAQADAAREQLAISRQHGKISARLASLEEARATANLVPSHLYWTNNADGTCTARFDLNNIGGPAWNIRFTGIHFAYRDVPEGAMGYASWPLDSHSIEVCLSSETVTLTRVGHLPEFQEGSVTVLALTGVYRDVDGDKELLFERLPTAVDRLLSIPSVRQSQDSWLSVLTKELKDR